MKKKEKRPVAPSIWRISQRLEWSTRSIPMVPKAKSTA